MKNDPEIKRIPLTSRDERQARLDALYRLFPDLFDGEGVLDAKALRALIGDDVSTGSERFRFEWAGKQQSKKFAFSPSRATLNFDPAKSQNADGSPMKVGDEAQSCSSENMIISGDNLEVLKLLARSYFEQVKCIYIDPPYNTGRDFIYRDDYSTDQAAYWNASGHKKDGVRLTAVSESGGRRHSNWLSMMQSRLLVARSLLRSDGVIFVSIDNVEYANLKRLMGEVFGEEQFVQTIIWKKRSTPPQDKIIGAQHDYILIYCKDAQDVALNLRERSAEQIASYKNPDGHAKGPWFSGDLTANVKGGRFSKALHFPITNPNTGVEHWPGENGNWRFSAETIRGLIANDEIYFGPDGKGTPKLKRFLQDVKDGVTYSSIWDFVPLNQAGSKEIEQLLGSSGLFENPKPVGLIEEILRLGSNDNDLVMDFFAGSGTTAQACFQLAKKGSPRKFILVQIPEAVPPDSEAQRANFATIVDLTIERVKQAGKLQREHLIGRSIDTGFRTFSLEPSNFPENTFTPDSSKSDADNLNALEEHLTKASQKSIFTPDHFPSVVTEIALKFGFGLSYTTERLCTFTHNRVLKLSGNGKSALLCLDDELRDQTIEQLKPLCEEQLLVSTAALDTTKKFELHSAFQDNLWVV